MKTTCIALLRGINVGGKNIIKMEQLRQCFIDMQFSDVRTYIQSGNVIFRAHDANKSELIKTIENQLFNSFSLEIKPAVFTANEIEETVKNAPENFGTESEKYNYDVWFLLPPVTPNDIVSNIRLREGVDFLQTGKNVIYTSRLLSKISKSGFSKIMQTPLCKTFTVRNWNTTKKLFELIHTVK